MIEIDETRLKSSTVAWIDSTPLGAFWSLNAEDISHTAHRGRRPTCFDLGESTLPNITLIHHHVVIFVIFGPDSPSSLLPFIHPTSSSRLIRPVPHPLPPSVCLVRTLSPPRVVGLYSLSAYILAQRLSTQAALYTGGGNCVWWRAPADHRHRCRHLCRGATEDGPERAEGTTRTLDFTCA